MKYKKALCHLMTLTMLAGLAPPAAYASEPLSKAVFSDIDGHWAQSIVEQLHGTDITSGYPDGTFRPNNTVSRAEFSTWILNVLNLEENTEAKSLFLDIEGHWYEGIIDTLVEEGILVPSEYGDTYAANTNITRMEMVRMMVRSLEKLKAEQPENPVERTFSDMSVLPDTDKSFMKTAVEYGLISGYPDGTVQPYAEATRAESAAMISRLLNFVDETDKSDEDKKEKENDSEQKKEENKKPSGSSGGSSGGSGGNSSGGGGSSGGSGGGNSGGSSGGSGSGGSSGGNSGSSGNEGSGGNSGGNTGDNVGDGDNAGSEGSGGTSPDNPEGGSGDEEGGSGGNNPSDENTKVGIDTDGDGVADKEVSNSELTDGVYTDPETNNVYKDFDGDNTLTPATPVDKDNDGNVDSYIPTDKIANGEYTDPETGDVYEDTDGDGVFVPKEPIGGGSESGSTPDTEGDIGVDTNGDGVSDKTVGSDSITNGVYKDPESGESYKDMNSDNVLDPVAPLDKDGDGVADDYVAKNEVTDGTYTDPETGDTFTDSNGDGILDSGSQSGDGGNTGGGNDGEDEGGDNPSNPDNPSDKNVGVDTDGDGVADKNISSGELTDGVYTDTETGKSYKDFDEDKILEPATPLDKDGDGVTDDYAPTKDVTDGTYTDPETGDKFSDSNGDGILDSGSQSGGEGSGDDEGDDPSDNPNAAVFTVDWENDILLPGSQKQATFKWSGAASEDVTVSSIDVSNPEIAEVSAVSTLAMDEDGTFSDELPVTVIAKQSGTAKVTGTLSTGEKVSFDLAVSKQNEGKDTTAEVSNNEDLKVGNTLDAEDVTVSVPIVNPDGTETEIMVPATEIEDVVLQEGENELQATVTVNGAEITVTIKVVVDSSISSEQTSQTLTFTAGEGGSISYDTLTVKSGIYWGQIVKPEVTPMDGYVFDGWYNADNEKMTSMIQILWSQEIEARFVSKNAAGDDATDKVLVSFVATDGGSIKNADSVYVDKGYYWGQMTKPEASPKSGYVFDGWYNADGEKMTSMYQLMWGQTITAKFSEIPPVVLTPAEAAEAGWTYESYEDGVKITGFTNTAMKANIEIPDMIGDFKVLAIGNSVFKGQSNLKSIELPNSIITIGDYAFQGCTGLTFIDFPSCSLSLGRGVFSGCSGIKEIYCGDNISFACGYSTNSSTSAYSTFDGYTGVVNISMSDAKFNIKVDGSHFTSDSKYTTMIANSSCKWKIDATNLLDNFAAFSKSEPCAEAIIELKFPKTRDNIPTNCLYTYKNLESIVIEDGNSAYKVVDGVLYSYDLKTLLYVPGGMDSAVIVDSVVSIANNALRNSSLTLVTIPSSVVTIGSYAFSNSDSLESVVIPDSVKSLGEYAFYLCDALETVTIPNSIANISDCAFLGCSALYNVEISYGVTSIAKFAFGDCDRLTIVTIPNSVVSIGDYAFRYCEELKYMRFTGTESEWYAISKGLKWNYRVNCNMIYNYNPTSGASLLSMFDNFESVTMDSLEVCNVITEYNIGDSFIEQGSIIAEFSDGTGDEIEITADMVKEFDTSTAGEFEVVLDTDYGEVTYMITVIDDTEEESAGEEPTETEPENFEEQNNPDVPDTDEDIDETPEILDENTDDTEAAALTSLEVEDVVTEYSVGDAFIEQGSVIAVFSDGNESEIKITADMVKTFDTSTAGEFTVILDTEYEEVAYEITVIDVPEDTESQNITDENTESTGSAEDEQEMDSSIEEQIETT